MESLELQKQLTIRDYAKRKYSGERSTVEANAEHAEKEIAESRKANIRQANEANRRDELAIERQRKEERQSANNSVYAQMQQRFAEDRALLANIDRQTNAAIADSNRVLAVQAAERARTRVERDDRAAEQRRDAERDRATRAESTRSNYSASSTTGGSSSYANSNGSAGTASSADSPKLYTSIVDGRFRRHWHDRSSRLRGSRKGGCEMESD